MLAEIHVMPNLFSPMKKLIPADSPLSARMRPRSLEEFVGQKHILGEGKLLTRAIEADRISSLILYGPPGWAKPPWPYASAKRLNRILNGSTRWLPTSRKCARSWPAPKTAGASGRKTILFIDEIHRFNKPSRMF
jgi:putative ATPase